MAYPQEYSKIRAMYNGSAAYELATEPEWLEQEEQQADLAPKPKKAVQTSYGLSAFAIVGYIAVAVVLILVLMTYVRYTAAAAQAVEYRQRIETLSEEQRKLTIVYEQTFDLNEIEIYARTVLGMDDPDASQLGVVSLNATDKAVVYGQDSEGGLFITGIAAILEYFG